MIINDLHNLLQILAQTQAVLAPKETASLMRDIYRRAEARQLDPDWQPELTDEGLE
jgi:hypothetical protein